MLDQIVEASGLGRTLASEVLASLAERGVIELQGDGSYLLKGGSKLLTSQEALTAGADIEEVSKALGWKDFEDFAAAILTSNGYHVIRNLRVREPRLEVDVLGLKQGLGLAVDCKHWNRGIGSTQIRRIAAMQTKRVAELLRQERIFGLRMNSAIPMILVLRDEGSNIVDGVPVLPVSKFQDFVGQLSGLTSNLMVLKRESAQV